MRRYGRHSQHRQGSLVGRAKLLAAARSVSLFRRLFMVCISTHLSSKGFQLRTATVLDSALPWMMPEIVHMARTTFVLNYSLPSVVQAFPYVSTSLIHSPTPKFLAFHSSSRPFFFIDQSFLPTAVLFYFNCSSHISCNQKMKTFLAFLAGIWLSTTVLTAVSTDTNILDISACRDYPSIMTALLLIASNI